MRLLKYIQLIPKWYSQVLYQQKKISVTKTDYSSGKSIKVYAKELSGNDFISLNYYITSTSESLKPCEMPSEKVIDFLLNFSLIEISVVMDKIGFGGGCHWCTEAVFQTLIGVSKVDQGFIASTGENSTFSEAVIVHFNPDTIPLRLLVEIHFRTHKSTVNHQMRSKYRSAIYVFSEVQFDEVRQMLKSIQKEYDNNLITEVLSFYEFKPSETPFANYYYNNPDKPFCKNHIDPKLRILLKQFSNQVNLKKLNI